MSGAFSRRSFLATTALGVAAGCKRPESPSVDASAQAGKAAADDATGITPAALATLESAMARILPTDEEPGAREAKCLEFMAAQLKDPALAVLKKQMAVLARVLDVAAKKNGGTTFAALDVASQDDLIGRAVSRQLPGPRGFDSGAAMRVLVTFTLEGFLGDPAHGGNAGQVGWKFAQFEVPPMHGPHHGLPQVQP